MRIKAFSLRLAVVASMAVVAFSCANIVPPAGGPRDVTPPKIIRSTPENFSRNFNTTDVKIVFDEYIKLSNLSQQLMISPPLPEPPEVTVSGKTLHIRMPDSLQPHTTYSFYFGNAVTDITEANAIPNFKYVFSTGDILDSLSVKGYVYSAVDMKPETEVYVMLYDNHHDTMPLTTPPSYITKTDKQGFFELSNLRDIPYSMFALADMNANLLFDLPNEKFAFYDSLVKPEFFEERRLKAKFDSLKSDTLSSDTLTTDSVSIKDTLPDVKNHVTHLLYMFEEKPVKQRLSKKVLERRGLVTLTFALPYTDIKLSYKGINNKDAFVTEDFNKTSDTLRLWIKDTLPDSLFAVIYCNDSILDTLDISLVPRTSKRGAPAKLTFSTNIQNNGFADYFNPPVFKMSNPLVSINTEAVVFLADSTLLIPVFVFTDSIKNNVQLANTLEEGKSYELFFPEKTFNDIFAYEHDTLRLKFKTRKQDEYGKLVLKVKLPHSLHPFIIQLRDDKGNVVKEEIITQSQNIEWNNMLPAKFTVKVIYDKNADGRWTTGLYKLKQHPEKIYLSKGDINTRAGWDVEIDIIPD